MIVTSFGCCCWPGRRVHQSLDCWSSCNVRGKIREGEEEDDKGMVSGFEGVQSHGGREMLSSMRDGICVCVAVVVVVVALMVAVGVVVLVVAVGVVVLVIVVRVLRELCIGVVEVVGILCIGAVVERDCTGVVDIMMLGGAFVVEVAVGCVMRLFLWCANGRGYFLCCFSLMSV